MGSRFDGEVIEANDNMPNDLESIKSPVNENGWIAKIKISDPSQLANLMDETAYAKYTESL